MPNPGGDSPSKGAGIRLPTRFEFDIRQMHPVKSAPLSGRPGAFPVKLHVKLAPHPAPGRALRQISILKLAARSGPRDASPIFRQISMSNWLWCPAPRLGVGTISIKNSLASVSSFQAWAIMCVFMFMSFCVVMLHRYGGVPGLAGCMGHASLRKARITFE